MSCLTKAPATQFQLTIINTKYFSREAGNLDILVRNLLIFNMSSKFFNAVLTKENICQKATTVKHLDWTLEIQSSEIVTN